MMKFFSKFDFQYIKWSESNILSYEPGTISILLSIILVKLCLRRLVTSAWMDLAWKRVENVYYRTRNRSLGNSDCIVQMPP